MMMEDYAKYDAQSCTLELGYKETYMDKETVLVDTKIYNVVLIHAFRQEQYRVLQEMSRLFYGSFSDKLFVFCEVYQTDDGKYLLVVGEDLRNVDQDMTICRVYDAPERVVKYLESL